MDLQTDGAVLGVFRIFCQKKLLFILLCRKYGPEQMYGSSQTYLFNYNKLLY